MADSNVSRLGEREHDDVPVISSDPGSGFVYVGERNGPPVRLDAESTRTLIGDLVWHLCRALGEDPS